MPLAIDGRCADPETMRGNSQVSSGRLDRRFDGNPLDLRQGQASKRMRQIGAIAWA